MKTAISSWSYHRLLDIGALSWEGAVDHAASIGATGFECVLNELDPEFAAHIFKYINVEYTYNVDNNTYFAYLHHYF